MSGNLFSNVIFEGFVIGGAIFGFLSAAFWIENKINDLDELIKELSSRLEDCEEKNAKNHELKK